ncbi:hypothetical protein KFL_000580400 [Klebsormidium nitens]|uniref:Uncharacterized protein n=1 Tax=Klebsormidium nitens TaxID=105231 RepID=A0A1Y1HVV2_KLENI|nr:hypothetical protein KFL_000580400 [Klebsormidium nitens]|eukprot:GAQ80646.1 hypothetical protein KFL_000580400 [Klebsormidium nitens]
MRNAAEGKERASDGVRILTPPGVRRRSGFPDNGTPPEERRGGKRARKSLFASSQGPVFDVFTRAGGDAKAVEKGGEDDGGVPVGKLLFEISPNTGRVHLYRGGKSRASGGGGAELLALNFPREELAKLKTEEDVRPDQHLILLGAPPETPADVRRPPARRPPVPGRVDQAASDSSVDAPGNAPQSTA